jgi:hypothetical protein
MSRDDGFRNANIDTGYFRDAKVKRLYREFPLAVALHATAGHQGIILESWDCGERLTATEGWPALLPWSEEAAAALRTVGLLDKASRLPADVWKKRFGEASSRRDEARRKGSLGGQRKAANRRRQEPSPATAQLEPSASPATAQLQPSSSPALLVPVGPSVPVKSLVPNHRTNARSAAGTRAKSPTKDVWADFTSEEWVPTIAAWRERGFRLPPSGDAGDDATDSQRAILHSIALDVPAACARWISEAPGGASPHDVVGYVLDQWHGRRDHALGSKASSSSKRPHPIPGLDPDAQAAWNELAGERRAVG